MQGTPAESASLEASGSSEHSVIGSVAMSHKVNEYLEELHLPPDTSKYEYAGLQHLEGATDHAYKRFTIKTSQSPFIIFTNLLPEEFDKNETHFPGLLDYNSVLNLLILTMVSFPHEQAARELEGLVQIQAKESGIRRILYNRGSTRTNGDRKKQADCSWLPRDLPPGRSNKWPSVALEVAYSESSEKVKKDMEYWLNQSNDVQLAISFDIKRQSGNIIATAWKRGTGIAPRTPANPEPEVRQEVRIVRGKAGQQHHITGESNLTIPFRDIMLRDPIYDGEKDLVLTREDLMEVAEKVWEVMDQT